MNKIDHLNAISIVNTLLIRIKDFRETYRLSEATFWDLLTIYWHQQATGTGITTHRLSILRYRSNTGGQALKLRRYTLIDRGLVIHLKNKTSVSKQGSRALVEMMNLLPVEIVRILLDPQYKIAA